MQSQALRQIKCMLFQKKMQLSFAEELNNFKLD